jgi:hypothetical protein
LLAPPRPCLLHTICFQIQFVFEILLPFKKEHGWIVDDELPVLVRDEEGGFNPENVPIQRRLEKIRIQEFGS